MRAYYSVIQYCPDLSRAEAANVGVVLFTEEPHQLVVRVSETFRRVEQFFHPGRERLTRIAHAARSTAARLTLSIDDLATAQDLESFAQTMGNDIRMTPPRVVVVQDLARSLADLYEELVGDGPPDRVRRAIVLPTAINRVFEQLTKSRRVWSPGKVRVPVIDRTIEIPYAYRNGLLNYVKPAIFADGQHADGKAARLAIEGDQLRKHPQDELGGGKVQRQLVVVSAAASDPKVERRVEPVFREYGVLYVPTESADSYARKVLQEAS